MTAAELRARYEELRDKEDATWQAWRILNRSRVEAFDAWLAAVKGEDIPVEVVNGPLTSLPCGSVCADAPGSCSTCIPQHPAEVCHEPPHVCADCGDCREAA
jgi:hypothetical protein